jgi:hypothetical protein
MGMKVIVLWGVVRFYAETRDAGAPRRIFATSWQ